MKLSKLIKKLESLEDKHGDIEVVVSRAVYRFGDGFSIIDEPRILTKLASPKTNPTIRLY